MTAEQTSRYLIAFLPWITLEKPVLVAGVNFVPFRASTGSSSSPLDNLRESLARILASYVDVRGQPVANCTVACIDTRRPCWNLSDEDFQVVSSAMPLLTLAAISKNDFFRSLGSYVNATAFQIYWQRFTMPPEWMALEIRRRDGRTLDAGYKHGEIKFTIPIQCKSFWQILIDYPIVDAFNRGIANNSRVMRRLKPALSVFNLANTDSETLLPEAEIIWMASAFEQLLDSGSNAADLSRRFGNLFQPYGTVKVEEALGSRPDMRLNQKSATTEKAWFVHRKWIEELYILRGMFVHGNDTTAVKWGWHDLEHLVMSALVFPLAVKICLSNEGHYALTTDDVGTCRAIDQLLSSTDWAKMAPGGHSSDHTNWQNTLVDSRQGSHLERAMREFEERQKKKKS